MFIALDKLAISVVPERSIDRFGDGDFNASVDDSGATTIIRGHFITGPATAFTPAP